jgi:hypothetical protein
MAGSDAVTIVAKLQALNRTWCINGNGTTDQKDGSTTANIVANIGNKTNKQQQQQQQLDPQIKQQTSATLTSLEKARIAISTLPTTTSSDTNETTATNASIVPHLFSALNEKYENDAEDAMNDEKTLSSSVQTPPSGTNNNAVTSNSNEYELRQMEWHIVLLLELWSCASSQSSDKEQSVVLDALAVSILSYRDQSRRNSRNNTKPKKKRKKRKKENKKNSQNNAITTTTTILSETEQERLFLDHLVQVLSRAPFLLPRDVPLSEFLADRILTRERLFWERLCHIVSHIYESFDVSNPFVDDGQNDNGDIGIDGSLLLLSSGLDYKKKNEDSKEQQQQLHSCSLPGGGKKKQQDRADETSKTAAAVAAAARKRKAAASRGKLQAIAKSKKRQRLASLSSSKKKNHRGSHFSRNLGDISKLLETKKTKKTKPISSSSSLSNSSTRGKMGIAKSEDGAKATLKERKASSNNITTATAGHRHSKKVDISARTKLDREKKKKKNSDMHRGNAEAKVKRGIDVLQSGGRSKRPSPSKEVSLQAIHEQAAPLIDPMETTALDNKRKRNKPNDNTTNNNGISNRGNNNSGSNKSRNIEVLPMTPRRTIRSDATLVVGETPVPSTRRFEATVVGETPVPGNGSSGMLETMIVGETPTYENNNSGFGSTPRSMLSSSSENFPFFSPPVLPSPTKLPSTASVMAQDKNFTSMIPLQPPQQQPVKLFGTVKLLKRTNSVGGSRGSGNMMMKNRSWDGNVQNHVVNKNGAAKALPAAARKGDGSSSIDKARAFLRAKSL